MSNCVEVLTLTKECLADFEDSSVPEECTSMDIPSKVGSLKNSQQDVISERNEEVGHAVAEWKEGKNFVPHTEAQMLQGKLVSRSTEYTLLNHLQDGGFGKVYRCLNNKTQEIAAVKICGKEDFEQELAIWKEIHSRISPKVPIIHLLDVVHCKETGCLVFELLEKDLLEVINEGPIPLYGIARILKDLLSGMSALKEIGIIHGDIKLENVMIIDQDYRPYRAKLIDFGLAVSTESNTLPEHMQSLFFRSPEVMLGLPYNEAIDMWSVGCLLGALLTRQQIFYGFCEYDMLRLISLICGIPPGHMICRNFKALQFYRLMVPKDMSIGARGPSWTIKTEEQYYGEIGQTTWETGESVLKSLDDAVMLHLYEMGRDELQASVGGHDDVCRKLCTDLLEAMLVLDPEKRITPDEALNHLFFQNYDHHVGYLTYL